MRESETMSDKRQELELRAKECVQGLHGLMTEAKREGYHLEVYSCLGVGGEPQSKITVTPR